MISLGQASNYTAGQVWRHLFACGTQRDSLTLRTKLAERYGVCLENVALYHTGRSALAAALQSLAPEGKTAVIIPGLTCIAVVRAVRAAGCTPIFVDLQPGTLEYDHTKLAAKLAELSQNRTDPGNRINSEQGYPEASTIDKKANVCYNRIIILVQNTLGISWNISALEELASQYDAVLVEDLAHCAGRFYADGREVGTVGAAAALSFGKGKAIDTISGGAVVLRGHQTIPQPTQQPKLADRLRDRWYPLFGTISRGLWRIKIGQIFMGALVKIGWVQRSADAELDLNRRLTHWQAYLALNQLAQLPTTPLREYKLVHDRDKALAKLQQNGYYFNEIWYDTPVSPARYAEEANFPDHECPETVKLSQEIINFPTWYPTADLTKAYEIIKEYEIK